MFVPPPWHSPTPDGNQRPMKTQVNVHLPDDASQSEQQALYAVAQDMVSQNYGDLTRWLNGNRRFISNTEELSQFQQRRLQMTGLNAMWSYNGGMEQMQIDVYPTGKGGQSAQGMDVDLDGYLVWYHCDGSFFGPNGKNSVSPYNLFFNGYLIEQNYKPQAAITVYPVLFGKTALLCESYTGSDLGGNKNPIIKQTDKSPPMPVTPPPGWGNYNEAAAPDGQTLQPAIPKELGYWIFDFYNIHNPCEWGTFGLGPTPQKLDVVAGPIAQGDPTIHAYKGKYFKSSNSTKSPLKPRGMNGFSAIQVPTGIGGNDETVTFEVFLAEFYDRGKFRVVSQSWTMGGMSINVNDSPLLYGANIRYGGFGSGGGFTFNLDPNYTKIDPTGDDTLMGPHMAPAYGTGQNNYAGLTDAQIAIVDDWIAACQAVIQPWEAQHNAKLLSLLSQINDPTMQKNVNIAHCWAFVARTWMSDATLYMQGHAGKNFWPDDKLSYEDTHNDFTYTKAGGQTPGNYVANYDPSQNQWKTLVKLVTTDNSTDPDHPFETLDPTYGPQQEIYVNLANADAGTPPRLTDYLTHAHDGSFLIPPWVDDYYISNQTDDNTTGQGTPIVVRTQTWDVEPNPPLYTQFTPAGTYWFGPGSPPDLIKNIDDYILSIMNPYDDLLIAYQAELNATPPGLPQFPNIGTSLNELDYSNITIDGLPTGKWSYDQ